MPQSRHELRILKGTNKCYVSLGNKNIYLGLADDPTTELAYHQAVLDYLTTKLVPSRTVAELSAAYLLHAKSYYRDSSQVWVIRTAIKYVEALYSEHPANTFGPRDLKRVRESMIRANLARKTCNSLTCEIRRMYRWGASEGYIPTEVYQSLTTVEGLRIGRSKAKETDPVRPVSEKHINAIEKHVTPEVWAMIQIQLLTGARPGEIVALRGDGIDQSGAVWTVTLTEHKTAWRGRQRTLYLGPRGQAILRPWLLQAGGGYLFSPRKAEQRRHGLCRVHRRPGQKPNPRKTSRTLGDYWSVAAYRRAIALACEKAEIPKWHPHQLRHTAATNVRKQYGLEAAQVILGHATADVTQIYAERDDTLARAIAEKMG